MNWSILVMLAAPYLLFAGICGLMVRAIRKARRERTDAEQVGPNTTNPPIEPGANDTA
jgi:putative effector of murein hydrolase LrgA (UPF0299 family)